MIDETTPKGRIVASALRLAAERPWREVTLAEIAQRAGLGLADLRQSFSSKSDILAAFAREIDDQTLRAAPKRSEGQSARDAIFEVVMSRFDQLAPYRAALRSILRDTLPDPVLARSALSSQHWMLEAAGVDTSRPAGAVRVIGLASVYGSVARTWLDDDDPGLARTMAALDRRLRSGERSLRMLDDVAGVACRVARIFTPGGRRRSRAGEDPTTTPVTGAGVPDAPFGTGPAA